MGFSSFVTEPTHWESSGTVYKITHAALGLYISFRVELNIVCTWYTV